MTKDYEITTCGLSCDLCDGNTTEIQDSANYLFKVFQDPMFSGVISMSNPNFKVENVPIFKEILEILSSNPPCPGCKERKDCAINQCVGEKGIENCSKCSFLDLDKEICTAPPTPPKVPMMPPAPIFFNGISKRYQNWNIKHLKILSEGNKEEINKEIDEMLKNGKSNRDIIDFSINLFEPR